MRKLRHMEVKVIWLISDGILTLGCLTLDTVPLYCIYLYYLIISLISLFTLVIVCLLY